MTNISPQFVGATRVYELVGRDAELEKIRHAIFLEEEHAFRLVVIAAPGGIGKTSLLRQTCHWLNGLQGKEFIPQPSPVKTPSMKTVCLPLIDMFDPELHSTMSFLHQVRLGVRANLHLDNVTIFTRFDESLARYKMAEAAGRRSRSSWL